MSGRTHSDATKTIISTLHKGKTLNNETKTKISDAMIGKTHNDDTKQKISDAMIGNTNSKNHPNSQKIEVFDLRSVFFSLVKKKPAEKSIITYDSINEAAKILNLPNISVIVNYFARNQKKAL